MTKKRAYLSALDTFHDWGIDTLLLSEPCNHYQGNTAEKEMLLQHVQKAMASIKSGAPQYHTSKNTPTLHPVTTSTLKSPPPAATHHPSTLPPPPPLKPLKRSADVLPLSHPADSCTTLLDLKAAMESDDYGTWRLQAGNTVFASGDPSARLMIVGEAPGEEENKTGKPFVGKSGQLLDIMLQAVGLSRDDLYITNVVPWHPPGNEPPNNAKLSYCVRYLEKHIALVRPRIIVLLGGSPTKALLRSSSGITKLRGHFFSYRPHLAHAPVEHLTNDHHSLYERAQIANAFLKKDNDTAALILPTLHPSYCLSSPSFKGSMWRDLLLLSKLKTPLDE